MNVIAVGSSFSQDATRYLHQIAKPHNVYHKVFNQYIGCCSIERCWYNAENDVAGYELEVNGKKTGRMISIKKALELDVLDFVTFWQVSHQSTDYSTYQPFLISLSKYIKRYAPDAEQVIHQTRAYERESEKPTVQMDTVIKRTCSPIYKLHTKRLQNLRKGKIVPGGEFFERLRIRCLTSYWQL